MPKAIARGSRTALIWYLVAGYRGVDLCLRSLAAGVIRKNDRCAGAVSWVTRERATTLPMMRVLLEALSTSEN